MDREYSSIYHDETSMAYKYLLGDIHAVINKSMTDSLNDQLQTFHSIKSLKCSKGSIIAGFMVVFNSKEKPEKKITRDIFILYLKKSKIKNSFLWQRLKVISYSVGQIIYDFPKLKKEGFILALRLLAF